MHHYQSSSDNENSGSGHCGQIYDEEDVDPLCQSPPLARDSSGLKWVNEAIKPEGEERNNGEEVTGWRPVEGFEQFGIDLAELYLGRRFATGSSGRLYQGIYRGQEVAAKILRPPANEADRDILEKQFKQEVSMLGSIHHPNIVQFVGACYKEGSWCIVTEYLSGGNLKNILRDTEEPLPWLTVVDMALDVASAMDHLHSLGIIHRDLKSDNLVMSSTGSLKLTDFGIARLMSSPIDMTAEMGTFRWMAPEMIDHKPYSEKVDVYSFGILLWEIIVREQPFREMTPVQAAFAVVNKNARPKIQRSTLGVFGRLMEACWQVCPEKRPSFGQILTTLKDARRMIASNPRSLSSGGSVKNGSEDSKNCCIVS